MARTNVYIRAGDSNRDTSIGGRKHNSSGWARLNTDNATNSDCCLVASVEVSGERSSRRRKTCDCGYRWVESRYVKPDGSEGWDPKAKWEEGDDDLHACPKCGRERQGMDTRKSYFEVELPEQHDENCEVRIVEHGHALAQLARMGAMLCLVKGVSEQASGDVKQGKLTVRKAMEILGELEAEAGKNIPNVVLPGGVTLAHALACVEVCRRMAEGRVAKN